MKLLFKLSSLLLLAISLSSATSQGGCTLCPNGEDITRPERKISMPSSSSPIPINDCATLDAVSSIVAAESDDCNGIQLYGPLCGCPVPETACRLCEQGKDDPSLDEMRLGADALELIQAETNSTDLTNALQAVLGSSASLTCGDVRDYLGTIDSQDGFCQSLDPLRDFCGCNSQHSQNTTTSCHLCSEGQHLRNQTLEVNALTLNMTEGTLLNEWQDFGTAKCGDIESWSRQHLNGSSESCDAVKSLADTCCEFLFAEAPPSDSADEVGNDEDDKKEKGCTLCPFGEPTPFPERSIDFPIFVPNCGMLEVAASLYDNDSSHCNEMQSFAKVCGCIMPEESCTICPNGEMTRPGHVFQWNRQRTTLMTPEDVEDSTISHEQIWNAPIPITCEVFDSLLGQMTVKGSETCFLFQLRGPSCGCAHYGPRITRIVKQIASCLSLLGSIFIIQDILRDRKKLQGTHQQLLFGVSIFDAIGSMAYSFGSIPLPAYSGIADAKGSDSTCAALAFFLQLSMTSACFNLGLAFHFWLVVCRNWSDRDIARLRYRVYAVLVANGIVMSCAALPFYEFGINTCGILPPPVTETWWPALFFFFVPICIAIGGATVFTSLVVWKVWQQERKSLKWRIGSSTNDGARRNSVRWTPKVLWKSLWYLMAFYAAYPIMMTSFFLEVTPRNFWIVILASTLGPSQGFWNFLVYVRYRSHGDDHQRQRQRSAGSSRNVSTHQQQREDPQQPSPSLSSSLNSPQFVDQESRSSTLQNDASGSFGMVNDGYDDGAGGSFEVKLDKKPKRGFLSLW